MDEERQVAQLHDRHLARTADGGDLAAHDGIERRIERLHGHHPGRERGLHPSASDRAVQPARGDLYFGQFGHESKTRMPEMQISVAADERTGIAEAVVEELRKRGHEPIVHGALADGERDDWAWAS